MKAKFIMKTSSLVICLLLALVSCTEPSKDVYEANFDGIEKRHWIGPEFWANPLQDWQVNEGRIECLVSNSNRNIHQLTHQLGAADGTLRMEVELGILNEKLLAECENWAGFSIGSKGEFDDYRNHAVFGKGLNIGVNGNGALFIGKPNKNTVNERVQKALLTGVKIKVNVTPKNGSYNLHAALYNSKTNELLQEISKDEVSNKKLIGDLVLVADFDQKLKARNYTKSVWFDNWKIRGSKIEVREEQTFGPILFSQYTLSKKILKLTAQMAPVDHPTEGVTLQISKNGNWEKIQAEPIDADARTAIFRIENWDDTTDAPYKLTYNLQVEGGDYKEYSWEGTIRKNPKDKEEIVVAGFTGNNDLGFPNTDISSQVAEQNPDVLFFSGDQIYEEVGGYYIQLSPLYYSKLDYLRKWYLFGWAYRDLLKDRPTVCITDDHDVYMGNIWGEGGRPTPIQTGHRKNIQDSGGYRMDAEWVKMVERTQTGHLPDPYDPTPVKQGIGVYYTSMDYGDISFAIIEDRKFKSAPKEKLPNAGIDNGWPQNKNFNLVTEADVPDAKLLGDRQLTFLNDWSTDWSNGAEMKVLLSQTIFANVATLPKEALSDVVVPTLRIMREGDYPENDKPVGDMDSNGWPQTGRNNAVKSIRKGFAFHLAGDQHLGSTIQYGVDDWRDSGYAFCVPSISNYWPRRWYPQDGGENRKPNMPKYTGDFNDGFGNKFSVEAVSNPLFTGKEPAKLYDRAAGYGIVRLQKEQRDIVLECWPRGSKVADGAKAQYNGWPITINQQDNFTNNYSFELPKISVEGIEKPVITVIDEKNNEVLYAIRINSNEFIPRVPNKTAYTVKVGDPDQDVQQELKHLKGSKTSKEVKTFNFIK